MDGLGNPAYRHYHAKVGGYARGMFDGNEKTLLFLALLVGGFFSLASQSVAPDEGGAVDLNLATLPDIPWRETSDGEPLQTPIPTQTIALTDGFYATLVHGYILEGEVVSHRRMRGDAASPVSPLDIGVVWGDLDISDFEFRPGNRVLWSNPGPGPVPDDWEIHVTNNHLLPATNEIRAALMAVEVGQRIRIEGYLVNVSGDRISTWRSSTRRNDNTIVGGCEIILVRGVEVLRDVPGDPAQS